MLVLESVADFNLNYTIFGPFYMGTSVLIISVY